MHTTMALLIEHMMPHSIDTVMEHKSEYSSQFIEDAFCTGIYSTKLCSSEWQAKIVSAERRPKIQRKTQCNVLRRKRLQAKRGQIRSMTAYGSPFLAGTAGGGQVNPGSVLFL